MAISQWRIDLANRVDQIKKQWDAGDRTTWNHPTAPTDLLLVPMMRKEFSRQHITKNVIVGARAARDALKSQQENPASPPPIIVFAHYPTHDLARESHDDEQWNQWLSKASALDRPIKITQFSDIHFPVEDKAALSLAYQVAHEYNPGLVIVGLDEFDNPSLSTWDRRPTIHVEDWLAEMEPLHTAHIDNIEMACPNAAIVYLPGNHDKWGQTDMKRSRASATLHRRFEEVIRSDFRVMYMGFIEELHIGSLMIRHKPDRTTEKHPALASLEATMFEYNLMYGDLHRFDQATKAQHRKRSAVISPCLCQLARPTWQHGIVNATVDLESDNVDFAPVLFHHRASSIWAQVGGKTLRISKNLTNIAV